MLWRVLIVVGYTVAFLVVVYAATCGSARGRRFIAPTLAVCGTWIIFYTALLFGVPPLSLWLVSLARLGHILTFTVGIFAGLSLRSAGREETVHARQLSAARSDLAALKAEMVTMEWE